MLPFPFGNEILRFRLSGKRVCLPCYASRISLGCMKYTAPVLLLLTLSIPALATPKPKVVSFGSWMKVPFFLGPNEERSTEIKIRSLLVDGKIKEFTTGDTHEITDRYFVVRRAFRLNDSLPDDPDPKNHRWKWQRGRSYYRSRYPA